MRGNGRGRGDVERIAGRTSVSDDGRRECECCDIDIQQRQRLLQQRAAGPRVVVVVAVAEAQF